MKNFTVNWDDAPEGFDYYIVSSDTPVKEIGTNLYGFHRLEGKHYYDIDDCYYDVDDEEITVYKRSTAENDPLTMHAFYVVRQRIEMFESLRESIVAVGGDPQHIVDPKITLGELVEVLAVNGIRFCVKD